MPASPTALAPTARPRRKGERTAERILDAAEALFAEHGYAGTTLRDVAQAADLRIPSLYNHFESKESLYTAVLERGIGPVLAILTEFTEGGEADVGASRHIVERIISLLARRPDLGRLVQYEVLTGGEHLTPLLRDWLQPIFAQARETLEASPGALRWDAEQRPLLVLALYQVVVGYFTIAPLLRDLDGVDLLSEAALAAQTRFAAELVDLLLEPRHH